MSQFGALLIFVGGIHFIKLSLVPLEINENSYSRLCRQKSYGEESLLVSMCSGTK